MNWDRNKLENLPYSRSMTGLTTMIPGPFPDRTYDVGGSNYGTGPAPTVRTYGRSGNAVVAVDGLIWDQGQSDWNSFEEVNVITAAKGADQMNAGVTVNRVLKSGGNQFHGGLQSGLPARRFPEQQRRSRTPRSRLSRPARTSSPNFAKPMAISAVPSRRTSSGFTSPIATVTAANSSRASSACRTASSRSFTPNCRRRPRS